MDKLTRYRKIVADILRQYAHPPSHGKISPEIIIDSEQKHYELMYLGWDGSKRIHGSVIHIDLIDGKIWIQHDGTPEGVASDLAEAGIPNEDIILAFRPEHVRKYTGYGV